ncbi:MAG: DUF3367 domain-containing protein [Acidimicrobiales bacterium]|nr:DUF3367 domain-containing protein [Acidimicrobiales bacterium]
MRNRWHLVVLAAVSWLPVLASRPGFVVADTKAFLYLNPGRLLADAPYVWDPGMASGTVTHQNIGYLWPMGPWFWLFDAVGLPTWIAQRLWLGAIVFAAATGARWLARKEGIWGIEGGLGYGGLVAGLAYGLSPYVVPYATRASVLLLPWAALPWLIGLTMDALVRQRWREPAAIALVVLTIGSINGSSLAFVALGVALWVPFAVWVHRDVALMAAARAVARIGVLCVGVSAWWLGALVVGGGYGTDVLAQSESLETVASGANATEVWRGLGNWVFYGRDRVDPWVSAAEPYTQRPWLIAATFALAALGLAALIVVRWPFRAFHLASAVVGVVLAVGVAPFDAPSPLGRIVASGAQSDLVLSLRSTHRALPLLVLATAMSLGAAVEAGSIRWPKRSHALAAAASLLIAAALPSWWTGGAVGDELGWDDVPAAWTDAAASLDAEGDTTRVLALPGMPFDARRWGTPGDPLVYGLLDRPATVRELIGFGSPEAAALLIALDERLQEGLLQPEAIAPIARLLGAGDIVFSLDEQYERYRSPRPDIVWLLATSAIDGLGPPEFFGEPEPNVAGPWAPMVDEIDLALPTNRSTPNPVVVRQVDDVLPIVRARPVEGPLVVAGDADGLVDLAELGELDPDRTVLFAASLDDAELAVALDAGARLVVTDTNRRRSRWWKSVRDMTGFTEQASGTDGVDDIDDARLEVFPEIGLGGYTVADQLGGDVVATDYGDPFSGHPEDRAYHAVDGDLSTAWRVAGLEDARGERLEIRLDAAVASDHVTVVQPQALPRNRHITEIELTVNGGDPLTVQLDETSLVPPGQVIDLSGTVEVERLIVEIRETSAGRRISWAGLTPVGFAEVGLGEVAGLGITEVIVPAPDLLDRVGPAAADHALSIVFTRERAAPEDSVRADAETHMVRALDLPAPMAFTLTGQARVSDDAADEVLDAAAGRPADAGVSVSASARLPGALDAVGAAALDGDPATAWVPPLGPSAGHFLDVTFADERTIERLDLAVIADGRHSVPTRIRVEAGDQTRLVDLPVITDLTARDASVSVPVTFEPVTGRRFRVVIDEVRPVTSVDWFSAEPLEQPVGIAELGIEGVTVPPRTQGVDTGCRDDLLTLDGHPVPVRVSGTVASGLDARPLAFEACDGPLQVSAGGHVLEAVPGAVTGFDLDRILLTAGPAESVAPARVVELPVIEITGSGPTSFDLSLADVDEPFWLVLGQGRNDGWRATVDGVGDLGEPVLVDGFANGWLVDPDGRTSLQVSLRWEPQRLVWIGLIVGVTVTLLAVAVVLVSLRRRAPAPTPVAAAQPGFAVRTDALGGAETAAVVGSAVVITALATRPWLGLVAGVLGLVVSRVRMGALVLGGAAAAGVLVGGGYIGVQQLRYAPVHDSSWPEVMARAHLVGWFVLAVVVVAAVDAIVRRRRPDRPDGVSSG